ncbi:prolyl oligopeptidase family serine peptidase [Streptomyces sp. NPDC088816]
MLAHLRGGGEFGQEWWHAGRLEQKQRTFDDLSSEKLRGTWR